MWNLSAVTKSQQAIHELARAMHDRTVNLPPLPGVHLDYAAPIIRNQSEARDLTLARRGTPSPAFALKGRNSDTGITNVRNVASPHWRRWLGVENRCVVPFTSFSENERLPDHRAKPLSPTPIRHNPTAVTMVSLKAAWRRARSSALAQHDQCRMRLCVIGSR
jgi:putative SOS response-associated peptidase YedK